jgi:methylglutaconyl-CoA hydratase
MSDSSSLRLERDGPVVRVTLNRPQIHNAFDDELVGRLAQTATELSGDDSVRVVELRSEGKSFCAGADLNWMQRMVEYSEEQNLEDSHALAGMYAAWDTLPKPVVGRIHGAAIGGGTGLVAVCDIAVASTDAVFAFSEVRLGILPAVISPFVMRKIGVSVARDLFLTGSRFPAERAREIGLVHYVIPGKQLDEVVGTIVRALLAGGPSAQARIKELIPRVAGLDPAAAAGHTAPAIAAARVGEEGQEGMRAFLEGRKAAWREEA